MLELTKIRELDLDMPSTAARPLHISAASGLVRAGNFLYIVADDEHHLGVFSALNAAPGRLLRMFAGELPTAKAERKARKPDLETLVRLPAFGRYSQGALLALGSGSRRNRQTGVLMALAGDGEMCPPFRLLDLSPLYEALRGDFDELNIEGAVVAADSLLLLQRGNKGALQNAVVTLDLNEFLQVVADHDTAPATCRRALRSYELGAIGSVPLCFSDGAVLPDGGLVFSAIAEDTDDSYHDGACAGAAIGHIAADGSLRWTLPLREQHKIEGVDAQVVGDTVRLLLVTDADDVDIAASLLVAELGSSLFRT